MSEVEMIIRYLLDKKDREHRLPRHVQTQEIIPHYRGSHTEMRKEISMLCREKKLICGKTINSFWFKLA